MSVQNDLRLIEGIIDRLDDNPVANFAYTQAAFDEDDVDGAAVFSLSAEQNIPIKERAELNQTVHNKGMHSQGISISRGTLNHYLGRTSFNLNKLIQKFLVFLGVHRASLAHNANEYDASAKYQTGDCCYVVETVGDIEVYSAFKRISVSPEFLSNVPPNVTLHWQRIYEKVINADNITEGTLAEARLPNLIVTAGSTGSGAAQLAAGTHSIKAISQRLIDNIAKVFSDISALQSGLNSTDYGIHQQYNQMLQYIQNLEQQAVQAGANISALQSGHESIWKALFEVEMIMLDPRYPGVLIQGTYTLQDAIQSIASRLVTIQNNLDEREQYRFTPTDPPIGTYLLVYNNVNAGVAIDASVSFRYYDNFMYAIQNAGIPVNGLYRVRGIPVATGKVGDDGSGCIYATNVPYMLVVRVG